MPYYKIDCWGRMSVIEARSIKTAKKHALEEEGRSNVKSVTHAFAEDVAWFRAMGGRLEKVD